MRLPQAGEVIGNLRLERFLGEGAVGMVWQARHLNLEIDVAVKVLKLGDRRDDPRFVERFRREAQILARLDHPALVRVLDFGAHGAIPYIVMELVDGFTLEQYLAKRQTAIAEPAILRILAAAASGLAAAHAAGVVHRDLKPGNLLISRKGALKVADLGLAREEGGEALTRERVMVGSPAYMAPEALVAGTMVDHRCDLYGLGVIGYQLVFGRLPYTGSLSQVINGHLAGTARFDLATTCGRETVALVRELMSQTPGDRPADAATVVARARRLLGQGQPRAATGSGSGSGSHGSSELAGMVRFLDQRLGPTASERGGEKIVHTTRRERLLVWLLLAGVIGAVVAGYAVSR